MRKLTFTDGQFVLTSSRGDRATIDIKAAAAHRAVADKRARKVLNRAFVKRYLPPSRPLPRFLDAHQHDGVRWILTRSRSYLAHAPGAGKSLEAIAAAHIAAQAAREHGSRGLTGEGDGRGQVVFLVPPSLTINWVREIEYWFGKLNGASAWPALEIVPQSAEARFTGWKADYLIVPDSMLTKPWVLERLTTAPIRFLAVDEASRFKEPTAQRTLALFGGKLKDGTKSPGLVYKPRHAVLLDGSPMPNRPMELWAPTYAMSPESIDFMSQQDFGFRYCGAEINERGNWEFKHSAREDELKERLQKSFMHVVTEDELDHPERRRSILFMNEDVRSPQQRAWERRSLNAFDSEELDEEMSQGEMASFRYQLGMKKVPWTATYIADRLTEKNESILLFAWHRDVCFELEQRLRKFRPGLIMGGINVRDREKSLSQFADGHTNLMIMNIAAGGRGLNRLQRADRVVFIEPSWSDEMNRQCEKRVSRKGADQSFVRCEYIACPRSMDEPILNNLFRKQERTKRIIG